MRLTNKSRRRFQFTSLSFLIIVLAIGVMIAGCGSDDSTSPIVNAKDFSGLWFYDYEVIGKKICNDEIGSMNAFEFAISQIGNTATANFGEGISVDLTINGSRVTGSGPFDDGMLELDFTLSDGVLNGTITLIRTGEDCTEVFSGSAARSNEPPSQGFVGSWDVDLLIENSGCEEVLEGTRDNECITLVVSNNTVYFTDDDGAVAGVGQGNTAFLFRNTDSEKTTIQITLSEDGTTFTGTVFSADLEDDCSVQTRVDGTKRTSPCPPPPVAADFAGSWIVDVSSFAQTGCIGGSETDYFDTCATLSVEGSTITLDDGTGRGPVTGSVDGSGAVLTRVETFGVYMVYLELDDGQLEGEAVMNYTSGKCSGSVVEIEFAGTSISSPCDAAPSGAFSGFWEITGEITDNGCNIRFSPFCEQFIQEGNYVLMVDSNTEGTVVGNTLYFRAEEGAISATQVLEISAGGDAFTGEVTLEIRDPKNPEDNCTSTASLVGTRAIDCEGAPSKTRFLGLHR